MLTCPKCLDYYADEGLAFCLRDGAPLVSVDPSSEAWREGTRILEEKEKALNRQQRKTKRRRVLLKSMTMLMATLVVFVIAVNGVIYLKPEPEGKADKADEPFREVAAKAPSVTVPQGKGGKSPSTSVPWPVDPPVTSATPITKEVITPTPRQNPTPAPTLLPVMLPTLSSTPVPTPVTTQATAPETPVCSDEDKAREREVIIRSYGNSWRRRIEGERQKIIAENTRGQVEMAEATLGNIEYAVTFFNSCSSSVVTAMYVWQLRATAGELQKKDSAVAKEKRFACMKVGGAWLCR